MQLNLSDFLGGEIFFFIEDNNFSFLLSFGLFLVGDFFRPFSAW